jgi:hypothetical protein
MNLEKNALAQSKAKVVVVYEDERGRRQGRGLTIVVVL